MRNTFSLAVPAGCPAPEFAPAANSHASENARFNHYSADIFQPRRVAPANNRQSDETVPASITRWDETGQPAVYDVTVHIRLAHREPPAPGYRAEYEFTFAGAELDLEDEPRLTQAELSEIAEWFDQHHDEATEHAADVRRDAEWL